MHIPRKFWHRQPRSASPGQDWLGHVVVGDPDPTTDPGTASRYQTCLFKWADQTSPTLILPWSCTRKRGHPGQHLAGTGEQVAAVHPQLLLRATAASVAV
jgi:hypothetical protein